jgi:hypothetical protein
MSKVLLLFVDGVGIGKPDPAANPFFAREFSFFKQHFGITPSEQNPEVHIGDKYYFPVDACLGVPGIPQSGTGQTSIFCGFNASAYIGKHFGPFPYSTLVPLIEEQNIFRVLRDKGKNVLFANAYPKVFFDYLKSGKSRRSVTSLSYMTAGFKLHTVTDVRRAKALTAEITNERWNRRLNYHMPVISPEAAARRLLRLAGQNDFTLYEYFLTDYLGHGRIADEFDQTLQNLDRFLTHLFAKIPAGLTVFLISDHGNLEDISIKQHTMNPALAVAAGKHAAHFRERVISLVDVRDTVIEVIENTNGA